MKKFIWLLVSLIAVCVSAMAYVIFSESPKTLADVTSPSGAWRIEVKGKDVFGGVEVTAVVHTNDGHQTSLGVIDLRPEWGETEHYYQAHESRHTRIDEVKAVVGDRLLLRDRFFPDEDYAIKGTIGGGDVELPIGEVNQLGFQFNAGISVNSDDHMTVVIAEGQRPSRSLPNQICFQTESQHDN